MSRLTRSGGMFTVSRDGAGRDYWCEVLLNGESRCAAVFYLTDCASRAEAVRRARRIGRVMTRAVAEEGMIDWKQKHVRHRPVDLNAGVDF